jgi:hypothetical protein
MAIEEMEPLDPLRKLSKDVAEALMSDEVSRRW